MTRNGWISTVLFLMSFVSLDDQEGPRPTIPAQRAEDRRSCELDSLPSDIRDLMKRDFGSWRVQEPQLLSRHAAKTWNSKNLEACPGIAVGLFQNSVTPSFAVLLLHTDQAVTGYKFIVFSRTEGKPLYEASEVEHSDDSAASDHFISKVILSDFFTEESKKKYNVQAPEGILLVDSAEQEYEADLYFWSGGGWRHKPVDD